MSTGNQNPRSSGRGEVKRLTSTLLCLALVACGGGSEPQAPKVVAFYGDSITAGRTKDIAQGAFETQDFAVPAQDSDAPLHPEDKSAVTVLRYGMADIVHEIPPWKTRLNLLVLVAKVTAMGRTPVVVNVSYTESGMERATNDAIEDITTIDVRSIPGATVDGIHPTEDYHAALNQAIHDYLVEMVHR